MVETEDFLITAAPPDGNSPALGARAALQRAITDWRWFGVVDNCYAIIVISTSCLCSKGTFLRTVAFDKRGRKLPQTGRRPTIENVGKNGSIRTIHIPTVPKH